MLHVTHGNTYHSYRRLLHASSSRNAPLFRFYIHVIDPSSSQPFLVGCLSYATAEDVTANCAPDLQVCVLCDWLSVKLWREVVAECLVAQTFTGAATTTPFSHTPYLTFSSASYSREKRNAQDFPRSVPARACSFRLPARRPCQPLPSTRRQPLFKETRDVAKGKRCLKYILFVVIFGF